MRNNDIRSREEITAAMHQALRNNDADAYQKSFDELLDRIGLDIREEYREEVESMKRENDTAILAARGARQLTAEERDFYNEVLTAMRSADPKQALANADAVMPDTVIDSIFDQLATAHPLLSKINFVPTRGAIKLLMNTNGDQRGAWGNLTATITEELTSGFKVVDATLAKASAFLPVAKAQLDLGPEWLDRYVREVLYEALANTLEYGIVTGTGKDMPIGMDRQVGDGVTVTSGVYPKKSAITVNDLNPEVVGNLISLMAKDENGKSRRVNDVILLVNPQDYFEKIMPATTLLSPNGAYVNDVLPYPMTIIQTSALDRGDAIIGMAGRYFAAAGISKDGRIEYSDEYRFLEDVRVYLIKTYANGMPKDNNAFLLLDIDGLRPAVYTVQTQTAPTASNVATLSSLKVGSLTLSPTFSASTDTYTASTSDASNVVSAIPTDAHAEVTVKLGTKVVENGSAVKWASGSNTLTATVTAEDGTTTKTYTVTVTKS